MVSEWPIEPLISHPDRRGKSSKSSRRSIAEKTEDKVRGTLNALKNRVREERLKYVKSQLEKNYENLQEQLREVERLSKVRDCRQPASADDDICAEGNGRLIILNRLALSRENSSHSVRGKKKSPQICSKLKGGNVDARRIILFDIAKLEAVGRVPSYTAWMFVDRNERMAKDQSIARRRRISYESNGKETFFCLDAEEEEAVAVDDGKETKDIRSLSESEEFISRMVILEHGSGRGVLETIADFLRVSVAKVESRFQSFPTEACGSNTSSSCGPPATIHSVSQVYRRSIYNSLRDPHPLGNLREKDEEQAVQKVSPVRKHPRVAFNNEGEDGEEEEEEEETKMSTTLELALDSFDTLFCRRCLVFNCALHACFEEIVVGINDRQQPCFVADGDQPKPCSPGCRFSPAAAEPLVECISGSDFQRSPTDMCAPKAWLGDNPGGGCDQGDHLLHGPMKSAVDIQLLDDDGTEEVVLQCELRTTTSGSENPALEVAMQELFTNAQQEKQARLPILWESLATTKKNAKSAPGEFFNLEKTASIGRAVEDAQSSSDSRAYKDARKQATTIEDGFRISQSTTTRGIITTRNEKQEGTSRRWRSPNVEDGLRQTEASPTKPVNDWNRLEQDLCEKGVQIFGKNSCLIAQNVLKGCKSCREIAEYLRNLDNGEEAPTAHFSSGPGGYPRSAELLQTGRVFRSKFRFGRKKVAPKSALGAIRKRIGREGGMLNMCRQYTPCSCQSRVGCGKDCPCVLVDTHCEKYCGCFKVCKNRFRGCQCSKSMCDRRHCPCFAAGRECDPDICKFCTIECGHSSPQGCRNMKILQRKKKRLLLAHSDVCTGWGVFTRHPLDKNDYIGEYTGELISHSEADRRGRIYDRETSFLFNLNDKLVVDAFRKGNKLKFANHSARKPNCYAKVLLVGGEHRVGIFAKDKIEAGEELLYDYQYEVQVAPLWATS